MSDRTLQILMVASEAAPYAKTGGLADVVGALPAALSADGHDVVLVMPWYPRVAATTGRLPRSRRPLSVPFGGAVREVGFRTASRGPIRAYFIDIPEYFDRPALYGEAGSDYPDNAERFGLFSRAALELARRIGFRADVIHCHDWQTGLVPVYLRQHLWQDSFFAGCGTLFTIHNLGYQGTFPSATLKRLFLDSALFHIDALEFHGHISLLKGGIRFADEVSTVSPTYCREIQTLTTGMGMDGLLRSRADHLHGILNGIDAEQWDPARDPALPERYSRPEAPGKPACKGALLEELGLQRDPAIPLAAMVTRLDPQKGIDLLLDSWDQVLARNLQLVVLGTGSPDFERRLTEAAAYYPDRASILRRFDDELSRRIYAGSDLFLMPSRYEPCGLGQLIALRYGTVPLVHATGGLADTVFDPRDRPDAANGFVFAGYTRSSFLDGLDRALAAYQDRSAWQQLMAAGMSQDLSWTRSAREYRKLYRKCIKETTT